MVDNDEIDSAIADEEATEPAGEDTLAASVVAGDSFRLDDELFDAFGQPAPLRLVVERGLPTIRTDEGDAYCPPLSLEEFVCLADERKFVIRDDWGVVVLEIDPADVERTPDGRHRASVDRVFELVKASRPDAKLPARTRIGDWVVVEPVRRRCGHYLEQLDPPAPGQQLRIGSKRRYCTYRRTVAGAFLELSHGAIRGCSARDPGEERGEELMRELDEIKIAEGENRVLVSMFPTVPGRA